MTTYKNPPVSEVVAEFVFKPSNWDLAIPGLVFERIKDDFPVRRMPSNPALLLPTPASMQFMGKQMLVPNPFPPRMDRIYFVRKDEKIIVQIAPNLLVVNNVKMYTEWREFLPVIRTVLENYNSVVGDCKIVSVGLQYVNQIKLPATKDQTLELGDYLQFYPHTGIGLPPHGPFMVVAQFPMNENKDSIQTQLNGTFSSAQELDIVLDIKSSTGTATDIGMQGIYDWMDRAHLEIVKMFEGCITDKLRETFGRLN